jgi:hypothetical protein
MDSDPGGPKTFESCGSGYGTLSKTYNWTWQVAKQENWVAKQEKWVAK